MQLSRHQTKAGRQVPGTVCAMHLGDTQNARLPSVRCRHQKGACSGEVPGEVGFLFINERYMPAQATAERSSFQPASGNLAEQKTGSRRGIKGSRVSQTAGGAEKLTQSVPRPTRGMKRGPLGCGSHLCLPLPCQRAGSGKPRTFPRASIQAWNISPINTINTIFKMFRRRKCSYEAVFN